MRKKSRGRPVGSEKDDSRLLAAVADLMLADPSLRPTTALKRSNPKASDADVRRIQAKWKVRGQALLETARKRREGSIRVNDERHRIAGIGSLEGLTKAARIASGITGSPALRAALALQDSPLLRAARGLQDTGMTRLIRELENNSVVRLARGLEDSPVMKALREQEKFIKTLRGF